MDQPQWPMPTITTKADGSPRQVGVKFELQGVAVDMLARLIALTLRGEIETVSEAEYLIRVPDQGDYRVEVEYALLKRMAKEQHDEDDANLSDVDTLKLDALSAASSSLVPCEVVAPPLAMESFSHPMQVLTDAIRDAGGKGTGHSLFYAFSLHLNVEPPEFEAQTVAAYMKAFACLYDWIVWQGEVDWARRITPYIQRYPGEYDLRLTDPDYWPDWDALIDDYLGSNATRNRALDMLPLFSEIDPATIRDSVNDDQVKARPAYNYGLANCEIDDPEWSIADPWRRWLQIEHLANDREALNACCVEYRKDSDRLLHGMDNTWREMVTKWLRKW